MTFEGTLIGDLQAWIDNATWDPLPVASDTDHCWRLLVDESDSDGLASDSPPASSTQLIAAVGSSAPVFHVEPAVGPVHLGPAREATETAAINKGRFKPIRHLGTGGFGVVIHAYDTRLHRAVAIKMMRPSLGIHPRLIQRFLREARAVASLQHTGIVQVFETGVIGSNPCIIGELVDGPNLADFMKVHGPALAPRKAAWVVEQVAVAVHFAHSRGILHRDLKPSNILLAAAPPDETEGIGYRPRLTDFGLAKRFDGLEEDREDLTVDVRTLGTLRYMSPEQASGRLRDVAVTSDVFTLGVILYQLITGKLPFTGQLDYEVAEQICQAEPSRARKLNPGIPRDLEAIVCKCLCKAPDERYSSAKALADDLKQFLCGLPVQATKPSAVQTIRYWVKAYPRKVAATALVISSILLAGVSSSIAWWKERYEHERAESSLKLSEGLIETAFFPIAEKLNDGATITHEDHRSILLNVLRFHQEHAQQNPNDPKLLHRLSVAHHFVANGFARLGQFDEAEKHRIECLRILEDLLVLDPPNRSKYLYQSFMAHLNVSGEVYRADPTVQKVLQTREMQTAADVLESLLKEDPDNVDYADAYNSLRIEIANHSASDRARSRELARLSVESSLQLWRKNPSRRLLAKPAVAGYMTLAEHDFADERFEDALHNTTYARELFQEAFGPTTTHNWSHVTTMEIHLRQVRLLLVMQRDDEALAACAAGLTEADEILSRRPDLIAVQARKQALYTFQAKAYTRIGNIAEAERVVEKLALLEKALDADSPEAQYVGSFTSSVDD